MFKNIIFDWSGVVKDALEYHLWLVNKIFKKFGAKEISMDELKENWEQPHMIFYNKYLPDITEAEEEVVYKEGILSKDCPKSKAFFGMCELIKKLKEKEFFLGIISSDLPDTILPEIKNYGLENIFDEVVFLSAEKTVSLKSMIEKFKLNPEETCFIGDSNHEIIAGKTTEVKTIAVTWGFNTEEYLKSKNPDYLAHNIKELENILLNKNMAYKPTIGLEIHAELKTNSKMFCSCKNDPNEKRPNYNICPVCTAQPGTLPVANEEAIKMVIKTGLALNCKIAKDSKFDRKNYFYPDLPKGYQISQYDKPLCVGGYLEITGRKIRITRIHLEEDTGSLAHPDGADYSLVNLNRAGVPLMELVTEPDITSGVEARKFAEELQLILKYLGVSDADMEKGLMRVEVNISVSKTKKLGTKVEIKNLNSFKVVEKAVDFEIARQTELLEAGEKVAQETRGWHDKKEITFSQREKEEAHDYRYFPEPDLLPLHFTQEFISEIKKTIPELPEQKRERFKKEYGLENLQIEIFITNKDLSEYFEKVVSEFEEWTPENDNHKKVSKLLANYLISDVQGLLQGKDFFRPERDPAVAGKITPENFAEFIKLIYKNEISSKIAKMVLTEMFNTGEDPSNIIDENNWRQMSDDGELEKIIKNILEKNPKPVADYKAGKQNSLQFLAGQILAATRGTANPEKVHKLLKKFLN